MTPGVIERFWAKVDKTSECWLWTGALLNKRDPQKHYGRLMIRPRVVLAHRLSWQIHFGKIPAGLDVLHSCDHPRCVRPGHLFLGTHLDNMRDKKAKGRCRNPRGSTSHLAKLTEENVIAIRSRYANGERLADLGRAFRVTPEGIGNVVHRRTWRHLK